MLVHHSKVFSKVAHTFFIYIWRHSRKLVSHLFQHRFSERACDEHDTSHLMKTAYLHLDELPSITGSDTVAAMNRTVACVCVRIVWGYSSLCRAPLKRMAETPPLIWEMLAAPATSTIIGICVGKSVHPFAHVCHICGFVCVICRSLAISHEL